jgi:hypothetical protein
MKSELTELPSTTWDFMLFGPGVTSRRIDSTALT